MKVRNIKCKLKHKISTMVISGSYMFESSVSKDMLHRMGGDSRKDNGTSMYNINYEEIEN
jgi:hypothetical protein